MHTYSQWKTRANKYASLLSTGLRFIKVTIDGETRLSLPRRLHRAYWAGDHADKDLIAFLARHTRGGLFVDIGANIGIYTMSILARSGAASGAIAFEPCAATFRLLGENLSLNHIDNAQCECIALSSADAEILLTAYGNGANNFWLRTETSSVPSMRVSTTTLDSYCHTHNLRPTAVKIDVEGHEYEVLKGAECLLRSTHPALVVECHCASWPEFGVRPDEVTEFLRDVGYETLSGRYGEVIDLNECRDTVHLCLSEGVPRNTASRT